MLSVILTIHNMLQKIVASIKLEKGKTGRDRIVWCINDNHLCGKTCTCVPRHRCAALKLQTRRIQKSTCEKNRKQAM